MNIYLYPSNVEKAAVQNTLSWIIHFNSEIFKYFHGSNNSDWEFKTFGALQPVCFTILSSLKNNFGFLFPNVSIPCASALKKNVSLFKYTRWGCRPNLPFLSYFSMTLAWFIAAHPNPYQFYDPVCIISLVGYNKIMFPKSLIDD